MRKRTRRHGVSRGLWDWERRSEPLLPSREFARRLLGNFLAALLLVVVSLGGGMAGYHFLARQSWLDSFLNAAMLLGGMGPVGTVDTVSGKVFAGFYALYSGLVFLVVAAIVAAPIIHRIVHWVHLVDEDDRKGRT